MRSGSVILIGGAVAASAAALLVATYRRTPFDAEFEEVAGRRMVDSDLLRALARQESNLNPAAVGPVNRNGTRDYGLMQINSATARAYGVDATTLVNNVRGSIDLAARLLLDMRRRLGESYSLPALVSAYNKGAAGVLANGITNAIYVQSVLYHHSLYSLGRLFR